MVNDNTLLPTLVDLSGAPSDMVTPMIDVAEKAGYNSEAAFGRISRNMSTLRRRPIGASNMLLGHLMLACNPVLK